MSRGQLICPENLQTSPASSLEEAETGIVAWKSSDQLNHLEMTLSKPLSSLWVFQFSWAVISAGDSFGDAAVFNHSALVSTSSPTVLEVTPIKVTDLPSCTLSGIPNLVGHLFLIWVRKTSVHVSLHNTLYVCMCRGSLSTLPKASLS